MKDYIKSQIKTSYELKKSIYDNNELTECIIKIATVIVNCIKNGGKILIAGNGGSAGDAQHFAGEFINRFYFDRPGLPCIALTTDTSVLTAIGNDYSFDKIFSKQVEALGKKEDIFIGISTSGNSTDIIEAMKLCKEKGILNIGLTGGKIGKMDNLCDYIYKVPSDETPRIQEAHLMVEHIICAIVEKSIFKGGF